MSSKITRIAGTSCINGNMFVLSGENLPKQLFQAQSPKKEKFSLLEKKVIFERNEKRPFKLMIDGQFVGIVCEKNIAEDMYNSLIDFGIDSYDLEAKEKGNQILFAFRKTFRKIKTAEKFAIEFQNYFNHCNRCVAFVPEVFSCTFEFENASRNGMYLSAAII